MLLLVSYLTVCDARIELKFGEAFVDGQIELGLGWLLSMDG